MTNIVKVPPAPVRFVMFDKNDNMNSEWQKWFLLLWQRVGSQLADLSVNTIDATGGFLSEGAYSQSYTAGLVLDYTPGVGRISVAAHSNITSYVGGLGTTPVSVLNKNGLSITNTDVGNSISGTINATQNTTTISLMPSLNGGAYNGIVNASDQAIIALGSTNNNGVLTLAPWSLNSVGIRIEAATGKVRLYGPAVCNSVVTTQVTTVGGLMAAGTAGAGARAFVTDATTNTFGSAVVGGGGTYVPVYTNGSTWYIG